jgi:LuxR family transcriptional regulator, maltose regulon positive regulatory protein
VPEIGESSLALTRTPGLSLTDFLVPVLVNELAASQVDVIFVLDDYHLITHDGIHEGLFSFVRHAPAQLELVVSTRVEPPFSLARLRASGDLVEVDAGALSFSAEEATELLNDLHGLALEHA